MTPIPQRASRVGGEDLFGVLDSHGVLRRRFAWVLHALLALGSEAVGRERPWLVPEGHLRCRCLRVPSATWGGLVEALAGTARFAVCPPSRREANLTVDEVQEKPNFAQPGVSSSELGGKASQSSGSGLLPPRASFDHPCNYQYVNSCHTQPLLQACDSSPSIV